METLIKEIDSVLERTKEYKTLGHLFSEDVATRTLAKLRQTLGQIKLKAQIATVKKVRHPEGRPLKTIRDTGAFVKVQPCADEFDGKTFLGIMIGDAALSSGVSVENDEIVCEWARFNPAILLLEQGKIVYGINSWWGRISSEDDLKEITALEIDNVWYVKALKQLNTQKSWED